MYRCKCSKEFESSQSYVAHCGHCEIHLGRRPLDRFGDSRAWSRGKTKETDERVRSISMKLVGRKVVGRKHTEATREKLSLIARHNAKNRINGWKSGDPTIPNRYEELAEEILVSHNVPYEREYVLPQSLVGGSKSYYRLDFLIDNKIDLEIDGTSHDEDYDSIRDSRVTTLYLVYRIYHGDSLEELRTLMLEFCKYYESLIQHQLILGG